jgi:hypothetical protein
MTLTSQMAFNVRKNKFLFVFYFGLMITSFNIYLWRTFIVTVSNCKLKIYDIYIRSYQKKIIYNFPEISAEFPLYSLDIKLSTQSFLNL